MSELREKMEAQLPQRESISFAIVFNYVAGLASIFGLVAAPFLLKDESAIAITYAISLTIVIVSLLAFTWIRENRKLHRYAQAVYFAHFVNHCIRDFGGEAEINPQSLDTLDQRLRMIVNAIATCFSIIGGKVCRVSLLELRDDFTLRIRAVDDLTSAGKPDLKAAHPLDENTEFHDVFVAENGHSRYYLCNDVVRAWKRQEYKSTFFTEYGVPKIVGPMDTVTDWKLPYRSVLVLPVRYVQAINPLNETRSRHPRWNYWGFLRIDCSSRNAFDQRLSPELGGLFADGLFTLTHLANVLLDRATSGSQS